MTALFSSSQGRDLVKKILAEHKPPIEAHDYQIEGICSSLDGRDLLATMATGAGKSGFFIFLMIVIVSLSKNPEKALGFRQFPKDPAMIVICPTKTLQLDMAAKMEGFGLTSIVINQDTVRDTKKDLWKMAITNFSMLLMSPEQLGKSEFSKLLDEPAFQKRLSMFGVDEAHLIYHWGKDLRPQFNQLGVVRNRLPLRKDGSRTPLVALTATLRSRTPYKVICKVLGLESDRFDLVRRSNLRPDIQIIFRELKSSLTQNIPSFPELDWILEDPGNTVLFCKTILLGFRVLVYLRHRADELGILDSDKPIRLCNSLNFASFNSDILERVENEEASITIATDVLSVGWDAQNIHNVVIIGPIGDVDDFVQKIGRAGRNREIVTNARAFWYYAHNMIEKARVVAPSSFLLEEASVEVHPEPDSKQDAGEEDQHGKGKRKDAEIDPVAAAFLLAPCKVAFLDRIYENPATDPLCSCTRCKASPPPSRPSVCNCSGENCTPEGSLESNADSTKKRSQRRRGRRISKGMREYGVCRFQELQQVLFQEGDEVMNAYDLPEDFLPAKIVKSVLDNFYQITTAEDITPIISSCDLLTGQGPRLFAMCQELAPKFQEIAQKKKVVPTVSETGKDQLNVQGTRIRWRINVADQKIDIQIIEEDSHPA